MGTKAANQPTLHQRLITRSLKVEEGGRRGMGIRGRFDEGSGGRGVGVMESSTLKMEEGVTSLGM